MSTPNHLYICLFASLLSTEIPSQFVCGFFEPAVSENAPTFSLFTYIHVTSVYQVPITCQILFWAAQMQRQIRHSPHLQDVFCLEDVFCLVLGVYPLQSRTEVRAMGYSNYQKKAKDRNSNCAQGSEGRAQEVSFHRIWREM